MTRPLNACLSAGLPKSCLTLKYTVPVCWGGGHPSLPHNPLLCSCDSWFGVQEEAHAFIRHHLSLLLTGLWKTLLLYTHIWLQALQHSSAPQEPWLFSKEGSYRQSPILEVRTQSLYMSLRAQHELYSLELHKCLLGKSWKDGEESRYQCSCHSRVPEKGITRRL